MDKKFIIYRSSSTALYDWERNERAPGPASDMLDVWGYADTKRDAASLAAAANRATRPLSARETRAIRANARGEHVYCGDRASALQIARAACSRGDEWSEEVCDVAARIARQAWEASRPRGEEVSS